MPEPTLHTVPNDAAGQRLDQFLAARHPELSRSRLKALIDEGGVAIDGEAAKASRRLRGGEAVALTLPAAAPASPVAQDLPIKRLYEDEDVIVLDKAPGVVVHPAAGVADGTLVNALLYHVKDLGAEGEDDPRPGIVHRLDRDTSGCLVVAKHETARAALALAFAARRVEKRYHALCHGVPAPDERTLDTAYGRHKTHRTRFTTRDPDGTPRRAISHLRVLEKLPGAALCEVRLETGRTHQIRVHLAESGHPLLADREYGGTRREAKLAPASAVRRAAEAIGRQALHARRLAFPHPRTGALVECEAEIPEDFAAALELLRAARGA
jgi:23S rRNA pseudouridine1911/1915/1917 synthase